MEKWLGPYTISEIPKLGIMTLVDKDDKILGKCRQNNIKKYYEAAETELPATNDDQNEKGVNVENKENDEHETDDNNDELDDSIFKTQSTFIDINAFEIDIDEILDPLLPSSESSNQGSGQTNVLKTGEKVFINISQ